MSLYYTTVNDVQEQLMKETPDSVPNPTSVEYLNFVAYLKNQLIPQVSGYIDRVTHRFFVPKYSTESLYNRVLLSGKSLEQVDYFYDPAMPRLYLKDDLLEITTYTSSGDVVTSTEYRVVGVPAYAVDLDNDSTTIDFDTSNFSDSQDFLGWWGYHIEWDSAFATIESITLADDSTATITVTDNTLYKYPQYVRCEDELMLITALTDNATLTVERGVRGTTAAEHAAKPLQVFLIDDSLHIAATRLCSWLYMNRVSQGNVVQISDSTVLLDTMPTVVKDNLERLTKRAAV